MTFLTQDGDDDPHPRWIGLIVAILVVLIIAYISTIPVNAGSIGATNIEVNEKYVSSNALCSCGIGTYTHQHNTFLNYCPNCHHYGTLRYEEGPASYTSPEGMWFCTRCDMDFCCQCGKSHDNRGYYLTPYTPSQFELIHEYGGYDKIPGNQRKPLGMTMGIPPIKL